MTASGIRSPAAKVISALALLAGIGLAVAGILIGFTPISGDEGGSYASHCGAPFAPTDGSLGDNSNPVSDSVNESYCAQDLLVARGTPVSLIISGGVLAIVGLGVLIYSFAAKSSGPVEPAAQSASLTTELAALAKLRDDGHLTQDEFDTAKKDLLRSKA